MADIFLSYSSKDREMAARVQAALSEAGYDVFWDQNVPAGSDWNTWIGQKLRDCRLCIVLWSKASVASRNVVHEATIAVEAKKLIPANIESLKSTDFPMGLYTVQGADLRTFKGGEHPGMADLLSAVAGRIGKRTPRAAPVSSLDAGNKAGRTERGTNNNLLKIGLGLVVGVPLLAFVASSVLDNFVTSPPVAEEDAAATQPAADSGLDGNWNWPGLECGQGPHIRVDKGMVTVTMAGSPTYEHAIDRVDDEGVHTIVAAPDSDRGAEYILRREGNVLSVTTNGKTDQWDACG